MPNFSKTTPPTTPKMIPERTYIRVTFHPNEIQNIAIAISLTSGDVIKNDNEIPKGILACIIPTNKGIEEQEQNGVIAPNKPAKTFPKPDFLFFSKYIRILSIGK